MEEYSFLNRATFNKILEEFTEKNNSKSKEKLFINNNLYDEIKSALLGDSSLRNPSFRLWSRENFTLLNSGDNIIVCRILNKKSKQALAKDGIFVDSLPVLTSENMYNVICKEHIRSLHSGQKELFNRLKRKWAGVKRKLVEEFVNNCEICVPRRNSSKSTLAAKPIVTRKFLSRLQVDLIDMSSCPDNEFRYILHARDHFSRFSWAKPLKTKESAIIASILYEIFCQFGPPLILQSDNGGEFTSNIIKCLTDIWPGLKIIHGRPRHPQSQGLVERGNGILEKKIGIWMETKNDQCWTTALNYIIYTMNNSVCRATNKTPYQIVFGMQPRCDDVWIEHFFKDNSIVHEDELTEKIQIDQESILDIDVIDEENIDNVDNRKSSKNDDVKGKGVARSQSTSKSQSEDKRLDDQMLDDANSESDSESDDDFIYTALDNKRKQPKPRIITKGDSNSLFRLKSPEIRNISWEEINSSWEGLFGRSSKLKAGVIKKEVLTALKDINTMRKTKTFDGDGILLDVWEGKFHRWLDILEKGGGDNKQMILRSSSSKMKSNDLDNSNDNIVKQSEDPSSIHDIIKNSAQVQNQHYRNNMKIFMEKQVKKNEYKIGDIINVKIPKELRNKAGRTHIPCKVTRVKSGCYWLACSSGHIKTSFKAECLGKTRIKMMKELEEIPDRAITLAEAIKLQEIFCKCPHTQCSTMKCICKKESLNCNSRCHPGRDCYNP